MRVYYEVGKDDVRSTRWQLWAHGTSFYLTNHTIGGLKVSLHGFDVLRPGSGKFHVRPSERGGLVEANDVQVQPPPQGWPSLFEGSSADDGRLAIRIRTTNRACSLQPPPPKAPAPRPGSLRAAVEVPGVGWSGDLDLTFQQLPATFMPADNHTHYLDVSNGGSSMRVPLPDKRGNGDAGFILRNDAGVVLTGRTRRRRFDVVPTPIELLGRPMGANDPSPSPRQIAFGVDDRSVLWIVEDAEYWRHVRPRNY